MRDVRNIIKNAARLGASKELVRKAVGKYLEPASQTGEVLEWCKCHASDIKDWIPLDQASLWEQALSFAEKMTLEAEATLQGLDVQLGGGGHYGLLYFLVRSIKPSLVVETGVAAGFSSKAILTAMHENGSGQLFSSDFPYCRLEQPEKYIGVLVDNNLKERWSLHIEGDRKNIPAFLSDSSVCIFDDIQNNWHFRDLVKSQTRPWKVFEFGGKFLGLIHKASATSE